MSLTTVYIYENIVYLQQQKIWKYVSFLKLKKTALEFSDHTY